MDPQRYSGAIISRVYLLKQGRNPGGQYSLKCRGNKLNLGKPDDRIILNAFNRQYSEYVISSSRKNKFNDCYLSCIQNFMVKIQIP